MAVIYYFTLSVERKKCTVLYGGILPSLPGSIGEDGGDKVWTD